MKRWIIRLIDERITPEMKCARVGHDIKVKIGVEPNGFQYLRTIRNYKTEQYTTCKRCRAALSIMGYVTVKQAA
jgi:hypothetical protein